MKEFEKENVQHSFKKETKWTWTTAIEEVYVFEDEVEFTVVRPDSGTNSGGVAYIWDEFGTLITQTKIPGNKRVTASLQSDSLDFERKIYVLGYGPDQVDQNVAAVAATVDIVQGTPGNYQPSTCYGYNNSATHVTSRYQIPKNLLDYCECEVFVVEGNEMLDSHNAINNQIIKLTSEDAYKGLVTLRFENGTFSRGKHYTVCLNVYSWRRQIAGYSFIY